MGGDEWRCAHTRSIATHTRTCVIFMHTQKRESRWCLHAKKIIRRKEKYVQKTIKNISKKDIQV
jgi:hypothetical protein